jgi:hypothetical protein
MKELAKYAMIFFALTLNLTFSACVGYKLGSPLSSEVKTIHVKPFANRCKEPFADIQARSAVITRFQEDGTLKITEDETADAILECSVDKIKLEPLRYDRDDMTKPNEYRMFVTITYVLKKTTNKKVLAEGAVDGETTFNFAGNMAGTKRSAMPKACEDMAKRLVAEITETW